MVTQSSIMRKEITCKIYTFTDDN